MKKHYRVLSIAVLLIIVAVTNAAYSTTIHVLNDGSTYESIQSGIDAASPGDTVLVHCGVYYEHDIELSSGIILRSEMGESDCVTIDAQNSGNGLWSWGLETAVKVEGFTIENGTRGDGGGAMFFANADVSLKNCCFANNNSAMQAMPGSGVVWLWEGTFEIADCVFTGNWAPFADSAALSIWEADAILTRCTVVNNEGRYGGGISLAGGTYELRECYIADNYGEYPVSTGGLRVGDTGWGPSPAQVSLLNSTITGNTAGKGGGVYIGPDSELTAFNTDIFNNAADNGPDGYCSENSTTLLTCCDVVEGQWFTEDGAIWELDNSDCTVVNEQMTWGGVKSLYK